jgi:hypothetical protein
MPRDAAKARIRSRRTTKITWYDQYGFYHVAGRLDARSYRTDGRTQWVTVIRLGNQEIQVIITANGEIYQSKRYVKAQERPRRNNSYRWNGAPRG